MTLKRIGVILLVSGVVALVANSVHPRKIPWVQDWSHQVEAKAASKKIKAIPLSVALERFKTGQSVFVDARSSSDFAAGHVAGAVSVPFESFDEYFSAVAELIDSGKELVVYCSSRECDDALLLASELQSMGYSNLVLFVDGFELWQKQDGPVERGAGETPAEQGVEP